MPVEMLDHGNEALRSADLTPAHAPDPDHRVGDERPAQRVRAADVILGATALDHRHEAVDDAEVERAIAEGFVPEDQRALLLSARDVPDLIAKIEGFTFPVLGRKWIDVEQT